MEYQVKHEDLERCFKFSVEYHLAEGKGSANRTTGQYRGLGGIIDSFFIGKLIEIGVASIIEQFINKKILLDFDIHEVTDDPDIVKIEERGIERSPKLYIEIKNTSPDDRWIGLTAEQFNTILKNNIVKDDPKKLFIVGASLISQNKKADSDPLGVFLKVMIKQELLQKFSDPQDLFVKIQYVIGGDELKNRGVFFNEGSYMYETEIFQKVDEKTANKIIDPKNNHIFTVVKTTGNVLPIIMRDRKPEPKEFGQFTYVGDLAVYKKENPRSDRMYVYCKSDIIIENKVLGKFDLKKESVYECFFTTVGRSPTLKRNNIWIAQRNLGNVISSDMRGRIQFIAENI
jgi:hypothetical protein